MQVFFMITAAEGGDKTVFGGCKGEAARVN